MNQDKYILLVQLADDKQQAAAERMRQAQGKQTEARSRLEQLKAFREEYRNRLSERAHVGMPSIQYQEFRQFLKRLDDAVQMQEQELEHCTERFVLARKGWQEAYKKLKAFEKLLHRAQKAAVLKTIWQEQKQSDEFASRQYWDKQQNKNQP